VKTTLHLEDMGYYMQGKQQDTCCYCNVDQGIERPTTLVQLILSLARRDHDGLYYSPLYTSSIAVCSLSVIQRHSGSFCSLINTDDLVIKKSLVGEGITLSSRIIIITTSPLSLSRSIHITTCLLNCELLDQALRSSTCYIDM
jgi:hypothetical protein